MASVGEWGKSAEPMGLRLAGGMDWPRGMQEAIWIGPELLSIDGSSLFPVLSQHTSEHLAYNPKEFRLTKVRLTKVK